MVSVDNGTVKALKEGTAVITCSSSGNSSVSASCTVTVKAKDIVDPGDTTDPIIPSESYAFNIVYTPMNIKSQFKGGEQIVVNVDTDAPIDKLSILSSNSNIQYNGVLVKSGKTGYTFSLYARKEGDCRVSILLNGKEQKSWNLRILSTDSNWATYERWLNDVLKNIEAATSNWKDLNPIQKITVLGQYILDNYDYNENANKSFHNDGCGNCNASAFVLKDFAQRYLNLDAQVVNPSYWASNTSHVVARVSIGDKYYDFDASAPGMDGKAGHRGNVVVMVLDK